MKRFVNKRTLTATAIAAVVIGGFYLRERVSIDGENIVNEVHAAATATLTLPFKYGFSVDGQLNELNNPDNSSSPYWWVSSGAFLELKNGVGQTNHGELPLGSKWQAAYTLANPVDTDGGLHPQNIFRMVLRSSWQDISQQIYYKIDKYNLSLSPNRNASNGLMQMSRYVDQNNLYYTGLRVDGYAVIKKKYKGVYYTLDYQPVIKGKPYDLLTAPNVLPVGTWIGVKTVTKNLDATHVSIKFYTDVGRTGTWTLAAQAIDDGSIQNGGPALTAAGRGGLRTDFMDAQMDDYLLSNP